MKRGRSKSQKLGPAAAAMRRHDVYRDARESEHQISASELLREAAEMQEFHASHGKRTARIMIHSPEELAMYRQKRRAELEERVRRGYAFIGNWIKYARWEAQQKDFARMRAVLERSIPVHGSNPNVWRDYAELEASCGFVQHAREVFHRGVSALPASVDLWLKYILLEQAAGQELHMRDVFERWIQCGAAPPCAFELYAKFEAERGRTEACRTVLRRFVESANSVEAWLFYANVETVILADRTRARAVLHTALQALPETLVWGPLSCRIPLALAELLAEDGEVDAAREAYQHLLHQLTQLAQSEEAGAVSSSSSSSVEKGAAARLMDEAMAIYGRFERRCGSRANYDHVARAERKKVLEARLLHKADDFDAAALLYVVLREESEALQSSRGGEDGHAAVEAASMKLLRRAVEAPTASVHAQQQRAVLAMELAHRLRDAGATDEARALLAQTIKAFPFDAASCPRVWLEAAALEEHHGEVQHARRLLRAALHVSADAPIFDAAIQLEQRAAAAEVAAASSSSSPGADVAELALSRCREVYAIAVKTAPLEDRWWCQWARMEERSNQLPRADALLQAFIQTATADAARTASLTHRYEVLGRVDLVWARRIALHRRALKQIVKKEAAAGDENGTQHVDRLVACVRQLNAIHVGLLEGVWADFQGEAVGWRSKMESEAAEPSTCVAPTTLPSSFTPALSRWTAAVEAVVAYAIPRDNANKSTSSLAARLRLAGASTEVVEELVGWPMVRRAFVQLHDRTRTTLTNLFTGSAREHGAGDELASVVGFDAAQRVQQWVALILSPLVAQWSAAEALHGGSLAAVSEAVAAPTTKARRTRLFMKR